MKIKININKYVIGILIAISILIPTLKSYAVNLNATKASYNVFIKQMKNNEIKKIHIDFKDDNFVFINNKNNKYITDNPKTNDFKKELLQYNIEINEMHKQNLIQSLKEIIFILFGILMISQIKSIYNKSEIKNKRIDSDTSKNGISFKDIAGLKQVKKDMHLLVEFLKDPEKFTHKGAKLPKGAILYGEPGTGKTLLAKALAGEANVPFFSINGSDFIEMFAGMGAMRVRSLFEEARENAPCIIFIDEIDAIGRKRDVDLDNSEYRQTLNALLAEMDGFNGSEGVLVIAATNRIEDLDQALLRPGRFDKHISVSLPSTPEERLEIIGIYSKNKCFNKEVDFTNLAKQTIGFSPAQIESLINEAVLISIQYNKDNIDTECIDKAMYKILLKGHAKEDEKRDKDDIRLVAWHEAGHALIGKLTGMDIPKVTITPSTSGAGGVTMIVPKKMSLYSIQELKNKVKLAYGGRIGELLLLGDENKVTTGASADIQQATEIIKQMIVEYGMDEKFGMLNLYQLDVDNNIILDEASKLSKNIYDETYKLLKDNIDTLKSIAELLIEKETICEKDLDDIINQY
ncbi:ATP-dependent metallopeptidase FtsH/Yme1/Tma family protein [Clostridium sporogenes]|uniref:ATP-dependent zinc metalloprotease FtsH n=2 Tax=Clostridium TaxID=1485 RepID=A0A6M0T2A6_CLOBO|nr:AAA family ATPase [Clostridium sporogenes]NFA61285.1 ATP-dependent zinc metalloprotease FtsH [Clostridium botulinum]APF25105.1 ATP-dependent metallopeptidase HflB family protein [Clostridium sporogenes]APH14035.1 ATP-dependent metallopeptidase HflB family protein [Clostridium sporogenes]NFI74517.1 ATP-dependent zinc metalloprotease FtsH [Clostridium sporogenes]NFP62156.1 ATP-dependent zinc metalloprotease FtsH [Clostridium sporogenes]